MIIFRIFFCRKPGPIIGSNWPRLFCAHRIQILAPSQIATIWATTDRLSFISEKPIINSASEHCSLNERAWHRKKISTLYYMACKNTQLYTDGCTGCLYVRWTICDLQAIAVIGPIGKTKQFLKVLKKSSNDAKMPVVSVVDIVWERRYAGAYATKYRYHSR